MENDTGDKDAVKAKVATRKVVPEVVIPTACPVHGLIVYLYAGADFE